MKIFILISLFALSSFGTSKRVFETDPNINPCEDFYGHVCSKVTQTYKLRDDRSRHLFAFNDSSDRILEARKSFLAGLKNPKGERQQNLKSLYQACQNEAERKKFEKEYVSATVNFIQKIPTLEKLLDYFSQQTIRGEEDSLLEFFALPDLEDPSQNNVALLFNLLSLPERTYYEREEVVHDFVDVVKELFDAVKLPNGPSRAESVVGFQVDAAKTYPLPVEMRDRVSTKLLVTREEAAKKWPSLRLPAFLAKLPAKTLIRNLSPENFTWLQDNLGKVPLQVLKDAYLFVLLSEVMENAYPAVDKKYFDFKKKHLGGPEKKPARNEECAQMIMKRYGMELDYELLPTLFPKFPEERVVLLAERVRKELLSSISKNEWLSTNAKKEATDKISKLTLQLVKPKTLRDWGFLGSGSFSKAIHFENLRQLNKLKTRKKYSELSEARNPNEWEMGPLEVNAYYNPPDNKFVLPIAILQYPFFDPSMSDEAIMGSMGAVIGHEIGHAVDDKGSKFNSKGQLVRWMTDDDLVAFAKRTDVLKKQLDDSEYQGNLKIGEFIGDLTGVRFAFQAAFPDSKAPAEKKKEFFLSYGRLWCEVVRPEYAELLKKMDPHPPGVFRTNGVLKHVNGFQEAFGCKSDSERVQIW